MCGGFTSFEADALLNNEIPFTEKGYRGTDDPLTLTHLFILNLFLLILLLCHLLLLLLLFLLLLCHLLLLLFPLVFLLLHLLVLLILVFLFPLLCMGVWQGVAMDSLKFHPGPPFPTLLCPVGGPPTRRAACGRFLLPWTPHAERLSFSVLS
jgi:hypothetical protein